MHCSTSQDLKYTFLAFSKSSSHVEHIWDFIGLRVHVLNPAQIKRYKRGMSVQGDGAIWCSIINNNKNTTSYTLGWKNVIIHRMLLTVILSLSLRSTSCKHRLAMCLSFNRKLSSVFWDNKRFYC